MKKCPRCEHEIADDEKFCPHCGLDLQNKYRPIKQTKFIRFRPFIGILVFAICMSIPMLFAEILTSFQGGFQNIGNKPIQLKEYTEKEATAVVEVYTTLTDFKNQFTNVDHIVKNIHLYEDELSQKYGHIFDKNYSIAIFDNNDILYTLTYKTEIDNDFDLTVKRTVSRSNIVNKEKMSFQKNHVNDFENLLLNEEEMSIVKGYTGEQNITNQLMNDFSKRKEEFEQKKENMGHYGLGNYNEGSSFVAHRKDKEYYSKIVYSHELDRTFDK